MIFVKESKITPHTCAYWNELHNHIEVFGYPFCASDYWRRVLGIGTEEVIRVGGPRHVSREI